MVRNRTIEIDLGVYVSMLEKCRDENAEYGYMIPDGLWNYFIEVVGECGITGNAAPDYVVDNLLINCDYGPCEDYLEIDDILAEIDEVGDDPDIAVREAAERYVEECCGWSVYDDPDSEYGTGICMSL